MVYRKTNNIRFISSTRYRSAQQVNSPKYLNGAHQTQLRTIATNKKINIAIFDNLDLRKFYFEINAQRYPRDGVSTNYSENDYTDQFRNPKLYFREYIGEPILSPFISYPDTKTKYSIEINDLRHQPDHITLEKIQIFQEYGTDLDNARLIWIEEQKLNL